LLRYFQFLDYLIKRAMMFRVTYPNPPQTRKPIPDLSLAKSRTI
jgi:hypothetical protein